MATRVTESMDLAQAMQRLKWLDEERRKDKATIAQLEERLQEQERKLAQQSARVQELQTSLSNVEAVLSKVDEFEQMVSNYKKEMTFQLEQRDETRRKEQREAKRLRRIEHEALKEHLSRLERELRVLPRHDEQLDAREAEEQRLSEAIQHLEVDVADLAKRLEDPTKAVSYLEEQRRADSRRITELEGDATELRSKIDNLTTKFPLLEETLQKQRSRIQEAIQETKKYEKPIEELRISDFQREQKMQRYLDQGEQVAQELERVREQTHGFLEQRQQVKRALSALEKFKKRIERRQDEMAERQRVAEERIERQWEEWQAARSKEQKKREVVLEHRWQEQEQTDAAQAKRLEALESTAELYHGQLTALWEAQRADALQGLEAVQDGYEALAAEIDEQLSALRGE